MGLFSNDWVVKKADAVSLKFNMFWLLKEKTDYKSVNF